ncbi:hypothetical protein M8C21_023940 [Ambrosia artemisiifolia]|uniref:Phytocyanin domain-containing protein n=1 Tax=Ambrosia artemisiifolia TaxID=4212 RepID=A0AAD5CPV6_AMBAR|nr:hypothetical protein M8C21_023940 [Ambrosia artemisiifolia]
MATRRGCAIVALAIICLLELALQCEAACYVVDWKMDIDPHWGKGIKFVEGDILVFQYRKRHNVVRVGNQNFERCTTSPYDIKYTSGLDAIRLDLGANNFISTGSTEDCAKMKIKLYVAELKPR